MNEKGITLVALTITVIVTLIIASVSITVSLDNAKKSRESIAKSELGMVGNAIVQTNTKYEIAKEDPNNSIGKKIEQSQYDEINAVLQTKSLSLKSNQVGDYILLEPEKGLKQIGINNTEDTYIVSFKTGEVFNYTKKKTNEGTILYVNAYGE